MKTENQTIACPHCGEEIDVNSVLTHQIEETIRQDFIQKENQVKKDFALKNDALQKQIEAFENEKQKNDELIAEKIAEEKRKLEIGIEQKLRQKIEDENKLLLEGKDAELEENRKKLQEFNKMKGDLARVEREKAQMKEELDAENEIKINEILEEERKKIKKNVESSSEFKIKELEEKLKTQIALTAEMQRKQEQGSMQLQGEVMELAIEEFLISSFPTDSISEIKKGASGADCLQTINTYEHQNCGTIYYESKRTKNFSAGWIEKFKNDIKIKGADLGVLVTDALPNGMDRMGLYQGVYVCTYDEFKGLAAILRQQLIHLNFATASQESKGEKMELLYQYLSSNEFRLQIEAIIDGFNKMKNGITSEKNAMHRIWKEREKQIDKVLINTSEMFGSIKGIAGKSIQNIEALEIGYDVIKDIQE
ncbi:DUF2130 domain-containing protein [Elizabethkingia anophelis]|nr:DUF2130 domain-containing protein [Elizabethkingia anophelis]MCT3634137.1 DUF2130 domain-containing protein [Elizabethkingia anophelis]MCT3830865.1 DUF2130 domain-containing protein [Elizabethkingia anophelis]MCT3884341.1 DUF2130 domain-containing protein [Elizabethkingia anophelis]MCT3894840.1 DUF2130 domain-containing protein [Elizabethkingia anophelis]